MLTSDWLKHEILTSDWLKAVMTVDAERLEGATVQGVVRRTRINFMSN